MSDINEANATNALIVTVMSDVVADTQEAVTRAAAADVRKQAINLNIGLGGGSAGDTTWLIAVLFESGQPFEGMNGIGNVRAPSLPLIQIPTTGAGFQVTPISIVTTGATTKLGVVLPRAYADLVSLDAALTVGLPPRITRSHGYRRQGPRD